MMYEKIVEQRLKELGITEEEQDTKYLEYAKEEADKENKPHGNSAMCYCPELNKAFTSMLDFSDYIGIGYANVYYYLNNGKKIAGKYTLIKFENEKRGKLTLKETRGKIL